MNQDFIAGVIQNFFGAIGVILSGNVSERLSSALDAVTASSIEGWNNPRALEFASQVAYVSLFFAAAGVIVRIMAGIARREKEIIKTALIDNFVAFLLAFVGLTAYSIVSYIFDQIAAMLAEWARVASNSQGVWYDSIIIARNALSPAGAVLSHIVGEFGGFLLVNQQDLLKSTAFVSLAFFIIVWNLRRFKISYPLFHIGLAWLVTATISKLVVAGILAVSVGMNLTNPATGVETIAPISLVFLVAGSVTAVLFFAYLLTSKKALKWSVNPIKNKGWPDKKSHSGEDSHTGKEPRLAPKSTGEGTSPVSSQDFSKVEAKINGLTHANSASQRDEQKSEARQLRLQKTSEVSHKVVLVSDGVQAVAGAGSVVLAPIPHVGAGLRAVTIVSGATKMGASAVERITNNVLESDAKRAERATSNTPAAEHEKEGEKHE